MSTHQFKTLTHEEGQDLLKSYSTKGGNCTAPSDAASFIFPTLDSSDAGWTAVYVCEGCGGEFFVEEFETKAQAILYLTTEDSAEEIREKYAPEPKPTEKETPKTPVHDLELGAVDGKLREWNPETRKKTPDEILAAIKEALNETCFAVGESVDENGVRHLHLMSSHGSRWATSTEAADAAHMACGLAGIAGGFKKEPSIYLFHYDEGWVADAHVAGYID